VIARALAAARPQPRRALSAIALGALTMAAGIGLLTTSGYLISRASQQPPILELTMAIVAVRFFGITRAGGRYLERLLSHDVAFRLLAELRVRSYRRMIPAGQDATPDGDALSRFVGDVDSVQNLFLRGLAPAAVAVLASVLAIGVAMWMLPAAGVVLSVWMLVAGIGVPLAGSFSVRAASRRRSPLRAALTRDVVELLDAAPELVAHGTAGSQVAAVEAADRRLSQGGRREAVIAAACAGLGTLVQLLAMVSVMVVSIPAVRDGRLDGVELAALAFLTLAAFEALTPLTAAVHEVPAAAAAMGRLERAGAGRAVSEPERPRPLERVERLEIAHGRLRYDESSPWVLDGIDLELRRGRRVALVGPSGSGKSTVARVLTRLCELDSGAAQVNGRPLGDYRGADVRRRVVLCEQDAHLFATTIRDNVRLGRPDATDGEVLEALRRARLAEWVGSLPDGLDTFVGEDGGRLSGGQRRRITLARALLVDADIVILDEPTAHLDRDTAATFVADLPAALAGAGLLMITHDLTLLDRFDEVVVLQRCGE
jgi:ATP-binding cassette, subfamily C, bacterial CydC